MTDIPATLLLILVAQCDPNPPGCTGPCGYFLDDSDLDCPGGWWTCTYSGTIYVDGEVSSSCCTADDCSIVSVIGGSTDLDPVNWPWQIVDGGLAWTFDTDPPDEYEFSLSGLRLSNCVVGWPLPIDHPLYARAGWYIGMAAIHDGWGSCPPPLGPFVKGNWRWVPYGDQWEYPGDFDDDDDIDTTDLLHLLGHWGQPYDAADMLWLIGHFGGTPWT